MARISFTTSPMREAPLESCPTSRSAFCAISLAFCTTPFAWLAWSLISRIEAPSSSVAPATPGTLDDVCSEEADARARLVVGFRRDARERARGRLHARHVVGDRRDHRGDRSTEVADHLFDVAGALALRALLGFAPSGHLPALDLAAAEHFERARHVADLVAVGRGRYRKIGLARGEAAHRIAHRGEPRTSRRCT
ncbi:MAG: hypothetical protein WDO17_08550 [Alphaproteobacteria bacterium]